MKIRLREFVDAILSCGFTPRIQVLGIICAAFLLFALPARSQSFETVLQAQVQALSQPGTGPQDPIAAKDLIARFYAARAYKPVWTDAVKRSQLRALVLNSPSHGLDPVDYHASLLDAEAETPEAMARREILYTDALIRFAYHLRFGKVNPHELYADWNYRRALTDIDAVAALEKVTSAPDLIQAVEDFGPRIPHYAALRSALAQQYALQQNGGGPEVQQRIDTLKVNLERIRWVAYDLPPEFVLVDIAGYDATMYRDGKVVWYSRAMVGKTYRKTPVFRADMTSVVLNPNWTVPPGILKADFLPKLKSDPNYVAKKGMQLLDENGKPTSGPWRAGMRIVQPPGPDTALGQYKFDMPNHHAVYLHDTPSKEKFSLDARAFSSGCIRLEKPDELALLLLGEQGWTKQQIDDVVATDNTKFIPLKRKIPVLILYFTVDVNGTEVGFKPDIYQRDARLIAALKEPFRVSRKSN